MLDTVESLLNAHYKLNVFTIKMGLGINSSTLYIYVNKNMYFSITSLDIETYNDPHDLFAYILSYLKQFNN